MTINDYKISPGIRAVDLAALMGDHRFPALLAVISDLKDEMVLYASDPNHANEPYKVAHYQGSISALLSLENQLNAISKDSDGDDDREIDTNTYK